MLLGQTMRYAGRFEEAASLSEKALRLQPYYPSWYLTNLAICYYYVGKYEEAIDIIKQYLQLAENLRENESSGIHHVLAMNYVRLGRLEDARDHAAKVLRLFPAFSLEYDRKASFYSNPAHLEQQHEDLQAMSGAQKPEEDTGKAGGAAAAAGSAAVAAAALDQFAEIDETEDDLMPGVEDEEALEAIQKLNTSLDEVSFEDLDTLPQEAEKEPEDKDEETSADQERTLTEDLGEQDDLESALKLFEMELEGRHPDASDISDETKAELVETAELLETGALDSAEQLEADESGKADEEDDLDFSAASEAFDNAEEESVDTVAMETEEAGEKSTPVSEEEVQAKVELAEAFAEMGDVEGAREILNEVMREGTESQRLTAEEILQKYAS
ncbi:MAG: FimV/HubP family polar landmark protein [Gammaproteobacteria bacterium]